MIDLLMRLQVKERPLEIGDCIAFNCQFLYVGGFDRRRGSMTTRVLLYRSPGSPSWATDAHYSALTECRYESRADGGPVDVSLPEVGSKWRVRIGELRAHPDIREWEVSRVVGSVVHFEAKDKYKATCTASADWQTGRYRWEASR